MPEASYCRSCRDYVWVGADGGCSNGHPRSDLQAIYDAPAAAGMFVPPPPVRPDGRPRDDSPQVDLLPQPTYWRQEPAAPEYRSTGSHRGTKVAVILGLAALSGLIVLGGRQPQARNLKGNAVPQAQVSEERLVIQEHRVLTDARGRTYVTGAVLNRSGRSLDRVHLSLTLYNQAGTAIGTATTELTSLGPEESGRFEIPVARADAARFRITATSGR